MRCRAFPWTVRHSRTVKLWEKYGMIHLSMECLIWLGLLWLHVSPVTTALSVRREN